MLRVGVLYPRSSIFPLLGAEFLSGLNASLTVSNSKENFQLITENIGFYTVEKDIYLQTEKLLLQENADAIIAYIDLKTASVLQPLVTATNKLLIIVNPGANFPENWIPPAGTIYLTLLDSFLSRLTGQLAANNSTESVLAASFYDGGYLHCLAMVN